MLCLNFYFFFKNSNSYFTLINSSISFLEVIKNKISSQEKSVALAKEERKKIESSFVNIEENIKKNRARLDQNDL
jgi:hypothetical protein